MKANIEENSYKGLKNIPYNLPNSLIDRTSKPYIISCNGSIYCFRLFIVYSNGFKFKYSVVLTASAGEGFKDFKGFLNVEDKKEEVCL
jgi:hypothetical protein